MNKGFLLIEEQNGQEVVAPPGYGNWDPDVLREYLAAWDDGQRSCPNDPHGAVDLMQARVQARGTDDMPWIESLSERCLALEQRGIENARKAHARSLVPKIPHPTAPPVVPTPPPAPGSDDEGQEDDLTAKLRIAMHHACDEMGRLDRIVQSVTDALAEAKRRMSDITTSRRARARVAALFEVLDLVHQATPSYPDARDVFDIIDGEGIDLKKRGLTRKAVRNALEEAGKKPR